MHYKTFEIYFELHNAYIPFAGIANFVLISVLFKIKLKSKSYFNIFLIKNFDPK